MIVIMSDDNINIVKGTTCFAQQELHKVPCDRTNCRKWFESPDDFNCVLLAARKGPQKQEQIGKYFGLTRMRVCQIEKGILEKARTLNRPSSS
jgi:hypothetical protein